MDKKIIVTGVTGQLGSYFVDFLLKNTDYKIIGTVRRLSVSNYKNIQQYIENPRFELQSMDLGDVHSITSLIEKEKPDFFLNCAANSFVGTSWTYPAQHLQFNALAVVHQLEAIRKYSPHTRYWNSGSSEEFGDVLYSPQNENHPPRARSPYGVSKITARQFVKVYRESYDLFAVQSWHFNFESERRGTEFLTRKVTLGVARILWAIKNNTSFDPIELGNVNAKRDWQHCMDVVRGVWLIVNQKKPKEYVLSSNETHSVREFVEIAFKEAGIVGKWVKGEKPEDETYVATNEYILGLVLVKINPKFYRPAEVDLLYGNSDLIRQELGWKPEISFPQLVSRMVKHDIENYEQ